MASSSQLREWWNPYRCNPDMMTDVLFFGKHIGGVATPTVEAFAALETALRDTGYAPSSRWAYNCRRIANSDRYSLHAYGIAIDIDPPLNPYVSGGLDWGKTAFIPAQIEAVENIQTNQGVKVWAWGGRWTTRQDYMHFQIDCNPAQLATGIKTTDPMPNYKGVFNVPNRGYAHDIIDRHLDRGVINVTDDVDDDWLKDQMTDGRFWNFLDRALKPIEDRLDNLEG